MTEENVNRVDISQRVSALVRMAQAANKAASMFSPGEPPTPGTGDDLPRLYEYQPGINFVSMPRAGYNLLPFRVLRALAETSKEVRLNIELIKRTVRGLKWTIEQRSHGTIEGYERETQSVQQFFEKPDGVNSFDAWLNMLLEDLLTIDAVTIYPDVDKSGQLISLDIVDGTTICPLLDARGRIPRPPHPAYLQVLYGVPTSWYTSDRMIYAPLNTRSYTPYGQSPTEWAIISINTAIQHDLQRLGAFTDGNIPGVMVSIDLETTTPQQIQIFQEYFDALARGDINRASKILFVPSSGSQSIYQPAQPDADKIEADRWLMQVVCWAFGNNPAEFGLIPGSGLGGAGFIAGAENAHYRSMIGPITGWLADLLTMIINRYMGRPDLQFSWVGLEPKEDEQMRAQIDATYINAGVYPIEYVQDRLGIPEKYRSVASATSQPDYQPLLYPILERAARYDLEHWRRTAIAAKKGLPNVAPYVPATLPPALVAEIESELEKTATPDDVANVFNTRLAGNVLAKYMITPMPLDPLTAAKRAGEQDLKAALEQYFAGLTGRITTYAASITPSE